MSRKWKERRQARLEGKDAPPTKADPGVVAALRRRRNRRFLVLGLIALAFPVLEVVAYQYRAITISVVNRTDQVVKKLAVSYPGGAFEAPELKPGGSVSRLIRPDFNFSQRHFATYLLMINYATEGAAFRQMIPTGTLDFSAQELYTIRETSPGHFELQHSSRPGFPLSLVRELMDRLGFG